MSGLERMADFFTARTDGYDEHMLDNVEGCREGYLKMAEMLPEKTRTLLDLGCGTGLELDKIFLRFPYLSVTGIDLTRSMLDKLKDKYPDKDMTLILGDYFSVELGEDRFDAAVSFETMHHFKREKKLGLYKRIHDALVCGGVYIECDYMVETKEEEDALFTEYERLKKEQGICDGELYHFDTPCTVDSQISMLKEAGFVSVEFVFRIGGTVMLIAKKTA